MEVILHIGMGKTGTTSIQTALTESTELLAQQGAEYLGAWFDSIDVRFAEYEGQAAFFRSTPEEMRHHAHSFIAALRERHERNKTNHFLISNEEIYGQVLQIDPFITELKKHLDVRLIAYVRNPYYWLPSAYSQWSIYHKSYTGPIRPYADFGKELIDVYSGFQFWGTKHPEILTVRKFTKSSNVVEDFSGILGLRLVVPEQRSLERLDVSEGILRAIYNNRLMESTLPNHFEDAFCGINFSSSPILQRLVDESFSYAETSRIIDEFRAHFDYIKDTFHINILDGEAPSGRNVQMEDLRARLLEHLLSIVMHQADRIGVLERIVEHRLEQD